MGATTATGNWNCVCGSRSQMRSSADQGNVASSYDGRGDGKISRSTGDVNSVFSMRVTPGAQAGGGPLPMAAASGKHAASRTPRRGRRGAPARRDCPAGGRAARAARGEVANGSRRGGGSKLRRAPLASAELHLRAFAGGTHLDLERIARARSKAVASAAGTRAAAGCTRRAGAARRRRRFLRPSATAHRRTRFTLLARRSERHAARRRRSCRARCVAVGARWRGGATREEAGRLAPRARHAGRRAPGFPGLPRAFGAAAGANRGQRARAAAENAASLARREARCVLR